MSEFTDIWVFSENTELMLELLAAGSALAEKRKTKLCAVLLGQHSDDYKTRIIDYGAEKVYVVDNPLLKEFQVETCLSVLTSLVNEYRPETFLIGSTKNGKELAGRLASKLRTGCTPDCNYLSIDEEGFLTTRRVVYSGNAIVTATYNKKPQIAVVQPRAFEALIPEERIGEIVKVEVEIKKPKLKIVETEAISASDSKIEDAHIVVCGGRGVESKEDFKLLEELAKVLKGQIGNTRPLAEDRKWFTSWVGLSGKKVKPRVYVGCGISGMIQHVAGMRDSRIVVAINKNSEAPIFEVADYLIVGDLYEIVPAIIEELKKKVKN